MLVILVVILPGSVLSQDRDFPVQVSTFIMPPYSVYLDDYTSPESNSLQVSITLNELNRTNYQAKLRVSIEGMGITLTTSPGYNPPPLILNGGIPEILSGFDIRQYLDINNLTVSGISRGDLLKTGSLPEGFYTFTIEVVDYNRNIVVSNPGIANAWMVLNDPPIINLPFNGEKVRATDPQNLFFSWTPRHTASPNAAFDTEYEFKLVEIYPPGRNPNDAILASNSIYTITTSATSINYSIAEPLLIPGRQYAFRIRAYDVNDRDLFKNNGYSEVFTFQFGDECLPPEYIISQPLDPSRFRLEWEPLPIHTAFEVQYRREGDDDWYSENVFTNSIIVPGLAGSTVYEYQVKGKCGSIAGDMSAVNTVSTPAEETSDFACGSDVEEFEISTEPLDIQLVPDMEIKSADFKIRLTEVQANGNGTYSGKGLALVPWFEFASVLMEFTDIRVNKDMRVYEGNFTSYYNPNTPWVADVGGDDELDESEGSGGDPDEEGGDDSNGDSPGDVVDSVDFILDGPIDSIAINGDGDIVITYEDGTTDTVEPDDDGITELQDSNGDTILVDNNTGDTVEDTGDPITDTGGDSGTGDPVDPGDSEPSTDLASGKVNMGPLEVILAAVPESSGTDSDGYCSYENITAEINLSVYDQDIGNYSISIPDTKISFKQHCLDGDFKNVTVSWSAPSGTPGVSLGKIGPIDAFVRTANLTVDIDGQLNGGMDLRASIPEDITIKEVFVIRKGLQSDFSFAFAGGQSFEGTFDLANITGIKVDLMNGDKKIAAMTGSFQSDKKIKGKFRLARAAIEIPHPNFKATFDQLDFDATYDLKKEEFDMNGKAFITLSEMKEVEGSISLEVTYQNNVSSANITTKDLKAFGMALSKFNLSAELNEALELTSLRGNMTAKHADFNTTLSIDEFEYSQEGLQKFVATGDVTYDGNSIVLEKCEYVKDKSHISFDAMAKVKDQNADVVVAIDGFTIDFEGNITMGDITATAVADVVLGPVLVKFDGDYRDRRGDKINGRRTRNISGEADIYVKTTDTKGKTSSKEIGEVQVAYSEFSDDHELINASLDWTGVQSFDEVMGIKSTLKSAHLKVDAEKNLTGSVSFDAVLEEDKKIKDIFILQKGLNGSLTYNYGGSNSYAGSFDFKGLKNINLIIKKEGTVLARMQNGVFDSNNVLTGTFSGLQGAAFKSDAFDVTVNELTINASYGFNDNNININNGSGKLTVSDIKGLEGNLKLGLDYGVDENFNAQVESGTQLSAMGMQFKNLSLNVDLTSEFDLIKVSGSLKASHPKLSTDLNVKKFVIEEGELKELNASGRVKYQGFDFAVSKCTYKNEGLSINAKLALNVTGTESKLAVKRFDIDKNGEISIGEVSGSFKKGTHLEVDFKTRFEESRLSGTFNGKLKTIGVGIGGTIDIGRSDNYNFAYLALEGSTNTGVPLGPTGLKLTELGGQIGYNYKLTYDESSKGFKGDPLEGNYLLGLKIGVSDIAGLCEVVGNPIVQFGENNLDLTLDGSLKITKNKPMIASDVFVNYKLPENQLKGSITTDFKVPASSGKIFRANGTMNFGFGNNQWYTNSNQINGKLLNLINFDGNFDIAGQSDPFQMNRLKLNGRVSYAYNVKYEMGIPMTSAKAFVEADADFNAYINTNFDETGFEGEMGINVSSRIVLGVEYKGYKHEGINMDANLAGRLGYANNVGYLKGKLDYTVSLAWWDLGTIPINVDYEFD